MRLHPPLFGKTLIRRFEYSSKSWYALDVENDCWRLFVPACLFALVCIENDIVLTRERKGPVEVNCFHPFFLRFGGAFLKRADE